jgi:hypothetical protein
MPLFWRITDNEQETFFKALTTVISDLTFLKIPISANRYTVFIVLFYPKQLFKQSFFCSHNKSFF